MNDLKFELLEVLKNDLTIEDALLLHGHGIVTICEDGKAAGFDFELERRATPTNWHKFNRRSVVRRIEDRAVL